MTETKNAETIQNIQKYHIGNTTYIVKSNSAKSAEQKILASINRLIQNDLARI